MAPWLGPGGHVGWPANHAPQAAQGVVTCNPGVWLVWLRVGKPPLCWQRAILTSAAPGPICAARAWQLRMHTSVPLSWQLGVNETEFAFGIGDKEKQRSLDWLLGQRSIRMHHRGLRPALGSLGMRENQSGWVRWIRAQLIWIALSSCSRIPATMACAARHFHFLIVIAATKKGHIWARHAFYQPVLDRH